MLPTLTQLGWTPALADAWQSLTTGHNTPAPAAVDDGSPYPARVMSVHRGHIDIASEHGEQTLLAGLLPHDEPLTVGDWIAVEADGRVRHVLPRNTVFRRRAPGSAREWQLIAANVDVLFIVTSCNQDFNVARLERYLVLAEDAGAWPVVVLTKTDLCEDPDSYRHAAERIRPGLAVESVNALDVASVQRLAHWCGPGQTVAFVGSSGVGKSTLINTLTGSDSIATGGIREDDAKGRHTTTARAMHPLPGGGWLLDTPGMREIQLADVHEGIEHVFDDIARLAAQCRFADCRHDNEPGCAVKAAIADGTLDADRLKRYRKLEREDARNSETLAERHARERQFGKMVKGAMDVKKRR